MYAGEGTSNGVFDMRDPESILRLVMFMWNIREDLRRIALRLESAAQRIVQSFKEDAPMQWRADTTPKSQNDEYLTREELFLLWRERTEPSKDTEWVRIQSPHAVLINIMAF